MSTIKARRFMAVGVVAAALALASIGATGVSANDLNDNRGAAVTTPVVQPPFTYSDTLTASEPDVSFADEDTPTSIGDDR